MIQNFTKNAVDKIMFAVLSLAAIVLFGALDGMPHCGPSMFFFGEPEYPNLDEEQNLIGNNIIYAIRGICYFRFLIKHNVIKELEAIEK